MKKLMTFVAVALAAVSTTFAQVKDYVCVVHDVFNDKTVSDLKDFSSELRAGGNKDFASAIDSFITGCFGSGFVYVDSDGTNYIVTNRHVVEDAKSLTIEFYNDDGSTRKFENLKVKAMSQDLDLALLSFPSNVAPFKKGLDFSTAKLSDGDEVWSAGFPALEGNPAWQFGKGNVTNAHARIASLVDPEISTIIQHSAQTDSGNSGGPLLLKTSAGYSIVGINTWKASSRQDTNFAIPVAAIKTFIAEATKGTKSENAVEKVSKQAAAFSKIISNIDAKYEEVVPFISMDFVAESGKDTFNEVWKQASSSTWTYIRDVFLRESPIQGMRYAIAWKIFNEFHITGKEDSKEPASYSEPELVQATEDYKVVYNLQYEDGTANSIWTNVYGTWQLKSFENANKKARAKALKKKNAIKLGALNIYNPYVFALGAGTAFITGDTALNSPALDVNMDISFNPFTSYTIGFTRSKCESYNTSINQFAFGAQLQLPILLNASLNLMPYGQALFGFSGGTVKYTDDWGYEDEKTLFEMIVGLKGGVRLTYSLGDSISFYADAGYKYVTAFVEDENLVKCRFNGVYLGAGVAF